MAVRGEDLLSFETSSFTCHRLHDSCGPTSTKQISEALKRTVPQAVPNIGVELQCQTEQLSGQGAVESLSVDTQRLLGTCVTVPI